MDEMTAAQLCVIRTVIAVMDAAGIPAWLFGGWGLDARIGQITRVHGDVGMLAMKEQFPHLRNGRPWRQKDIDDIGVLRRLASGKRSDGHGGAGLSG